MHENLLVHTNKPLCNPLNQAKKRYTMRKSQPHVTCAHDESGKFAFYNVKGTHQDALWVTL